MHLNRRHRTRARRGPRDAVVVFQTLANHELGAPEPSERRRNQPHLWRVQRRQRPYAPVPSRGSQSSAAGTHSARQMLRTRCHVEPASQLANHSTAGSRSVGERLLPRRWSRVVRTLGFGIPVQASLHADVCRPAVRRSVRPPVAASTCGPSGRPRMRPGRGRCVRAHSNGPPYRDNLVTPNANWVIAVTGSLPKRGSAWKPTLRAR